MITPGYGEAWPSAKHDERLDGSRELYDHNTDTAEYYTVNDRPEHEPLVKRLQAMLEQEFGPRPRPASGPSHSATSHNKQEQEP